MSTTTLPNAEQNPAAKEISLIPPKELAFQRDPEKNNQPQNVIVQHGIPEAPQENTDDMKLLEQFIITKLHHDDQMDIQERCFFSCFLLSNAEKINGMQEFFEEECHLGLLNWFWNDRKVLKNVRNNIEYCHMLIGLLTNILNIFKIIEIKPKDILQLKLYEKLLKIKAYVNNLFKNNNNIFNLYADTPNLIIFILNRWKNVLDDDFLKQAKLSQLLSNKRKRSFDEDDTEASSIIDLNPLNIKKNKKKLNVSFNFNQNQIFKYYKDSPPAFKISVI